MSIKQILEVTGAPTVVVERVTGRLIVRTWDEPRVQLRSSGSEYRFAQDDGIVLVSADGMTQLWVPEDAGLQINRVESDAHLIGIGAPIHIERVAGHALLEDCAAVTINRVYGHLVVRRNRGGVTAETISGNAGFDEIAGDLAIERCNGNLMARRVAGSLSAQVDGNTLLRLVPLPGGDVKVEVRGNIRCRVPADGQFSAVAEANGRVRVSGLPGVVAQSSNSAAFRAGEGGPKLTLTARGNIDLRAVTPEDEIAVDLDMDSELSQEIAERASAAVEQVAEQLESQIESLARRLDEQLTRLSSGDELASKVQEKVQRAMRKAEEAINRAAQRAAERDLRRDDRRLRGVPTPPVPPVPPASQRPPKRSPVTSEERMRILRMVETGKLSVEQAEMLLAALNR